MGKGDKVLTKWHSLFTTGQPLFEVIQGKTANVNAHSYTYTVPKYERWVLFGGSVIEGATSTNGSGSVFIHDKDGLVLFTLLKWTSAAASEKKVFPYYTTDTAVLGGGGYPVILHEGQKLVFTFDADADRGGTEYHYAEVLQFESSGDFS